MKHLFRNKLLSGFVMMLCMGFAGLHAQTTPRVLLAGDYPDPSILREGDDFYMTHSSFYYYPGLLIWHSDDLANWQPVTRALTHYDGGSVFAPDLVKCQGKYYIYYPAKGANYVVWADRIEGPWSEPVRLDVTGIDPGHVVGRDGKRYLFVDKGYVVPLSDDGLKVTGERKKVYDGWQWPKGWKTEGNDMYLESPKLFFRDGYYYMVSAEGGTAGPATSHMAVVARSKDISGPWENSPYNPLVHTYSASEPWWSKGHGTLVDDAEGRWWIVYHGYAQGYHTLGRTTLIDPVEWSADGWPKLKQDGNPLPRQDAGKHGMELSDDFTGDKLGLQWTFWKEYAPEALSFGSEGMTVEGKGQSPADGRLLTVTAMDKSYEVETEITLGRGAIGGLLLYYSEKAFAGLASDGKNFTLYRDGQKAETLPSSYKRHFHVRLLNRANRLAISVSRDGNTWEQLAEDIDVSAMHHNNHGGFYALRPALLAAGKGKTTFADFEYRNAIPQEKDMAAYLMVYHQDEDHSLHAAISRDGYTFTALNNGKPIIAGDTIAEQKGIRDPHIYRGPDGGFYLAMTDLHIYAQREGYRDTEWERDGKLYAWGNNHELVLMKSFDLIHWTRANIRFDKLSKEFAEIGCAWAPETVYDPATGRMMIYYTMRFGKEQNRLYYVYVNNDFNRIESTPQILFEYPVDGVSAIDGDITPLWNKEKGKMEYHLFYVAHEEAGGIKHAVSDRINGGYAYDPRWIDFEPKACEAPTVWKRIGEDKWVLMYDVFSINPHNFGFVETNDFVHFENIGRFTEPDSKMKATNFQAPKHGAVIHLTKEEADRLEAYWNK